MKKLFFTIFFSFLSCLFLYSSAQAAPVFRDLAYAGKFLSQSVVDPVEIDAGSSREVVIKIKNVGTKTWYGTGGNFVSVYTVEPNYHASLLAGDSWIGEDHPSKISATTKPGATAEIKIKLYAPNTPGIYTEKFYLVAENKTWIKGSGFFIKIKATKPVISPMETETATSTDAVVSTTMEETTISTSTEMNALTFTVVTDRPLINEPNIRVGIYKTDKAVKFISDFDYQIFWGENLSSSTIVAGTELELSYAKNLYKIKFGDDVVTSTSYIRLAPLSSDNYFVLKNYDRYISGRDKINFNVYRGTLEYKYIAKAKMPWVINELPLDFYTAGVAETSKDVNIDYAKAVLVAARTYGYMHIDKTTAPAKRTFDVYATTVDQLYLGYNSELYMPRIAQAAGDTYGEMVTYKNNVVITPYFSNSNGKTKSWAQAWGGADKPWLQSVECKYDKGKTVHGHGVGMSNADAAVRAIKDGWTYVQLLQHYYIDTAVEKIY